IHSLGRRRHNDLSARTAREKFPEPLERCRVHAPERLDQAARDEQDHNNQNHSIDQLRRAGDRAELRFKRLGYRHSNKGAQQPAGWPTPPTSVTTSACTETPMPNMVSGVTTNSIWA